MPRLRLLCINLQYNAIHDHGVLDQLYVIPIDGVEKIICHGYCTVLSCYLDGINSKNTICDGDSTANLKCSHHGVAFINQRMP